MIKNWLATCKRGIVEEQYAVDVYHDGLSGLFWAREFQYDLIILDIMLPGQGWDGRLSGTSGKGNPDAGDHAHG